MELLHGLGVQELTTPELTGDWEFRLRQIQRRQLRREQFMAGIAEMTRRIVDRAKTFEHDTIPGDFGVLRVPCPRCGGEIHEKYKAYQCVRPGCGFALPKALCGRMFELEEVEQLVRERQVGPLQHFRSKRGKPFAAVLKLNAEGRVEFDFGGVNPLGAAAGGAAPVDLTGKTPLGRCPQCGGRVFEAGMNYLCEHVAGVNPTCRFRTARIILQQPVEPAQLSKLLAEGRTDLLRGFVSKKTGRKFEAFLVLKDGRVAFEFAPRPARSRARSGPTRPTAPPDFTGQTPVGKCPRCGGRVFEDGEHYVCERAYEPRPCRFRSGKVILQQPVDREQMAKLLTRGRTDRLTKFVSAKTGRPFAAALVLDASGKVTFDFEAHPAEAGPPARD